MKRNKSSDFSNVLAIARHKKNAPRGKLRVKQRSMKAIERELWELCRQITFSRYLGGNCYTCPQVNLQGINKQCGHYFPKGAVSASLKYDIRILRTQCARCNIFMGGMGGTFRENMKKEIGAEEEQKLYNACTSSKGYPVKARDHYEYLIERYKKLVS